MSKQIEALKLALEALENAEYGDYDKKELNEAITALRQAIAEDDKNKIIKVIVYPAVNGGGEGGTS